MHTVQDTHIPWCLPGHCTAGRQHLLTSITLRADALPILARPSLPIPSRTFPMTSRRQFIVNLSVGSTTFAVAQTTFAQAPLVLDTARPTKSNTLNTPKSSCAATARCTRAKQAMPPRPAHFSQPSKLRARHGAVPGSKKPKHPATGRHGLLTVTVDGPSTQQF
jgi:hypothetical protein